MMEARIYNIDDYDEIATWWVAHGWDAVPNLFLPPSGVVITEGDKLLAAGWIYADRNVPVGNMEWLVTNPGNTALTSAKALTRLVTELKRMAEIMRIRLLFTSVQNKGLIKLYERNGFVQTDQSMTNMTTVIGGN